GTADLPGAGECGLPGRLPASPQRNNDRLWEVSMQADDGRRWLNGQAALGGLLGLLGVGGVCGRALGLELGRVGWPFLVITPGLALLGLGLAAPGRLGEVLAMIGGLVTVNGLVLG